MYALLIVGGQGERLRPYTEDRPKPMVEVAGKPLLEHHLAWLKRNGVTHAILLCGYLHHVIQDHFQGGSRIGMELLYSIEDRPLGRGGALKKGFSLLPSEESLVIATNGDNITNQTLAPMIEAHLKAGAMATVMLTRLRSPYGIAAVDPEGRITGFREKPLLPHWLNAGVYVFSRQIYDVLPDEGDHENSTFPQLAQQAKLLGFRSQAYWKGVDTVKDLAEVAEALPGLWDED